MYNYAKKDEIILNKTSSFLLISFAFCIDFICHFYACNYIKVHIC